MLRQPRKRSASGICHVMARGFTAWQERDDKADCRDAARRAGGIAINELAPRVMRKASGSQDPEAFPPLPDRRRAGTLQRMRRAGAWLDRIARLTGTGMAIVRKAAGSR